MDGHQFLHVGILKYLAPTFSKKILMKKLLIGSRLKISSYAWDQYLIWYGFIIVSEYQSTVPVEN